MSWWRRIWRRRKPQLVIPVPVVGPTTTAQVEAALVVEQRRALDEWLDTRFSLGDMGVRGPCRGMQLSELAPGDSQWAARYAQRLDGVRYDPQEARSGLMRLTWGASKPTQFVIEETSTETTRTLLRAALKGKTS